MAEIERPAEATPHVALKDFLENVHPGRRVTLASENFRITSHVNPPMNYMATLVPLYLHCSHKDCEGMRFFEPTVGAVGIGWDEADRFFYFSCRNCRVTIRTFAVRFFTAHKEARGDGDDYSREAFKLGETPAFGPPLSAKLLQLAGSEIETLKKGRRSENQSLGIGAFAYYRRVVESQKLKLIDGLAAAIKRLGGGSTALATLEAAKAETQFSRAIELMANVTPKELYLGGQNPLTLLHGPLSVGLHSLSDAECLDLAHNIRLVLTALLERIQSITEEQADLDQALKGLLKNSTSGRTNAATT